MARRLTTAHLDALRNAVETYASENTGLFARVFRDRESRMAEKTIANGREALAILSARKSGTVRLPRGTND